MKEMKESPCLRCRRVAAPEKCDNKDCALWRRWFTERWDQIRMAFVKVMAEQEKDHELEGRGGAEAAQL